jgi:hypothetical protein
MKTTLRRALAAGLLLATATLVSGQQPAQKPAENPADSPKMVRVQVEFIDVAHEQLTTLLFGERKSTDDTELRKQVGELVAQSKATIVETMICLASDGQKATTESIKEFIYATEYEPAELPNTVQTGASGDKSAPVEGLATGPTPSAWDTRNTGSTLEVEPNVAADGRTVSLRFVPEIVYHLGEHVWSEWRDLRGNADIKMPMFYTLRLNSAVTTIAGQPLLVAALSPKGQDGAPDRTRKVMIFVRCDVLGVPAK